MAKEKGLRSPTSHRVLKGSERRKAPSANRLADADPTERFNVSIILRRKPSKTKLPDQAHWIKTPPGKRSFLSREQFSQQFGADPKDVAAIQTFAKRNRLRVIETSLARRTVVVSGTVRQFERIFLVDLGIYSFVSGVYRGREGRISVPLTIASSVVGVFGLDNRPMLNRQASPAPPGAAPLTPPEVARLYQFNAGSGAGQTIGIIEYGGGYVEKRGPRPWSPPTHPDIDSFFASVGLATPHLSSVLVDGATNNTSPSQFLAIAETSLDIDVAGSIAPETNLVVYFAPGSTQGMIDAITTAIHDDVNKPSVISISWGDIEGAADNGPVWNQATLDALSAVYQEGAALGISILVASGDDGSNCNVDDGSPHVLYPASDPWVTACGGTIITNVAGDAFNENTWNDKVWATDVIKNFPLYVGGATGGGFSTIFPRPAWQVFGRKTRKFAGRGVPDIAGNASQYSAYMIWSLGAFITLGGTSAVAPMYAGFFATMNARLGFNLGYLNPTLYQAKNISSVFRDINDGVSNAVPYVIPPPSPLSPGFSSGPGWDPCTGLGVIVGSGLLELFIPTESAEEQVKRHRWGP